MKILQTALFAVAIAISIATTSARAEIDGHGPDAWRVTGVSANDVLNARMGPGTTYPVIETFAHNERGMEQITCVPFYTTAHSMAMSQAQINALPSRWCLMRSASMIKAGWVAQRFITPDYGDVSSSLPVSSAPDVADDQRTSSSDALIAEANGLVRELYDAYARSEQGHGPNPIRGPSTARFFTSDIVAVLQSDGFGAHPLYGGQDFDIRILRIAPDPDQPMYRGTITINVDFTNFGRQQRAIFHLRADTTERNAPLRIFYVEHDGWSYP